MFNPVNNIGAPSQIEVTQMFPDNLVTSKGEKAFDMVTIRLNAQQRAELERQLDNLQDEEQKLRQACEIIDQGNVEHPFFKEVEFDLSAPQALRKGKIELAEFETIMKVKSALHEPGVTPKDIKVINLFDDKTINMRAWNAIQKTNVSVNSLYSNCLSDSELSLFFLHMSNDAIPSSEKRFYYIPDTRKCLTEDDFKKMNESNQETRLAEAGVYSACFNLFQFYEEFGVKYRMIPSFTMMQQVIDDKYGSNAIRIHPVLSLSLLEEIKDNLFQNKHDLAVYFFLFPLPSKAHNKWATPLDFNQHDFYHCWVLSAIPQQHRELFLKFSTFFEEVIESKEIDNEIKSFSMLFKEALIDLEGGFYRKERITDLSDEEKFYKFLESPFTQSKNNKKIFKSHYFTKFAHFLKNHSELKKLGLDTPYLENLIRLKIKRAYETALIQLDLSWILFKANEKYREQALLEYKVEIEEERDKLYKKSLLYKNSLILWLGRAAFSEIFDEPLSQILAYK